jgi:FkbM family methyltransferase
MRDFIATDIAPVKHPDTPWAMAFLREAVETTSFPENQRMGARTRTMLALLKEHVPYHAAIIKKACAGGDHLPSAWEGPAGALVRKSFAELVVHLGAGFARVGRAPQCNEAGRWLLQGAIVARSDERYVPPTPPYRYVGDETGLVTLHFDAPIFVDLADNSVTPELMQQGWWEPWIDGVVQKSVGRGDIAVNVGANLGYHVLRIAHFTESPGRIFAFEPNPRIAKRLARTIQWGGLIKTAMLFPCAVADTVGEVDLIYTREMSGHGGLFPSCDNVWRPTEVHAALAGDVSQAVRSLQSPATTTIRVPSTTLDETVGRMVDHIHFLMIDTEQSEPLVLGGARELIARSTDLTIIMEWTNGEKTSPSHVMREKAIEMVEWLESQGFIFWGIEPSREDIFLVPATLTKLTAAQLLAVEGKADVFARRQPMARIRSIT